ncbi:hypothetical protein CSKR_111599 [Clonorchis sinensis]|uniref:Uncharacterized protein n=1 Tax=Clonorchis sinensis TaxID=79923 RepID=A0A8T1MBP3_CLOSI|nr:hypothetical protein CSKR_111599 [Clonorchis sinensis]
MRSKGKKKLNLRQKRYKEVVQQRISTKTPPVQYTRRLKTRKHKKLKHVVSLYSQSNGRNKPPKDDSQHVPASFKELMQLLESSGKRVRPPYLSGVGDTQGMRKPCPENKLPKQGKHESDAHYIGRVHKEVADEMARLQFAKTQKTQILLTEPRKGKKQLKSIERLREKKYNKKLHAVEKRLTGFEHLKDVVKFNEVVTAPPTNLTKPKKVGASRRAVIHPIDKMLQT